MRIWLKKNVTIHKLENKLSLFDAKESTLYTFNKSAELIVNGLKLGWNKQKITQGLKEKYGASNAQAEEDYTYVADFLREKQLIEEK